MRLILTGKSGQLGFELQRALAPVGEVIALGRKECDLSQEASLRACIQRLRPDVIVNAAAYTAVDQAESAREMAYAVNDTAVRAIGEEASQLDAWVVHYSTDYVFDGEKRGPYSEDDIPNPQNVYGASKLAGERALQASGAKHLIFRTSWVLGQHGNNFVKTILRLAQERTQLHVVADQLGAPTSAALIAAASTQALQQILRRPGAAQPSGLYHLSAAGTTSWHAYALHIIAQAQKAGKPIRLTPAQVQAVTSAQYPSPTKRPQNSLLDTRKIRQTFGVELPHWQLGVDAVLNDILSI